MQWARRGLVLAGALTVGIVCAAATSWTMLLPVAALTQAIALPFFIRRDY